MKDIQTKYTKMRNVETGRRGYGQWKYEKETVISPKNFGMFLQKRKEKKFY